MTDTDRSAAQPPGSSLVPPGPLVAVGGLVLILLAALLLREVASLLVPVIFGLFLALVTWPLVGVLERRGLRRALALSIAIAVVVVIVLATFGVIAVSIGELVLQVPRYQDRLTAQVEAIRELLAGFGISTDLDAIASVISPGTIAGLVRPIASAVSGAGIALFVLTFTMLYALAGAGSMQDRARQAFGDDHPLLTGVEQFGIDLRRYLVVRALLGVFAGVAIFVVLIVLSVPLPALWAFLVFAASFIPNIGTIIALVPTTIIAFLDGGAVTAVIVVVAYAVINFAQDHFLQPVIMGSELNLTPLVVFIAVIAWAWVLGAAGALLAVPLTVGLVAIMEAFPASRPVAALLRNKIEPPPSSEPDPDAFTAPLDEETAAQ
jgi:predicted PurR-regulated permease PerM